MIGWMNDVAEATDLVYKSRFDQSFWDSINDLKKSKALLNGYDRIIYSGQYPLIPSSPTPAQLVKLKKAQIEMSYYLIIHQSDEDRRKGLQAQGVITADIVGEEYSEDNLMKLPIPPFVDAILAEFKSTKSFYAVDIGRAEEEDVDFKDFDSTDY